ncbi:MAG: transposase [Acidimicrobiaceae bacterium]|nr:transposase [Acidimicrobiaceae bacterium]
MKSKRHTPEQVIRKLAEGDKMLNEGSSVAEVARSLGVTETTWHRWKNQYGGMKTNDAKKLKELEMVNRKLKTIVADQALDILMLKEIASDAPIDQTLCRFS